MDSTKRRCPSANTVSKARDDFPAPDGPVTTVTAWCGIRQSIPLRLCVLARWTTIDGVLDIPWCPPAPARHTVDHGGVRSWAEPDIIHRAASAPPPPAH